MLSLIGIFCWPFFSYLEKLDSFKAIESLIPSTLILFSSLIIFAFFIENYYFKIGKKLSFLGDSSYAIYLTHMPIQILLLIFSEIGFFDIEEFSSYEYHYIRLKQSPNFSYNPIYIDFEINATSTLADTTIYILQKYDNYDTEYLDKYEIKSDSPDDNYTGFFICSRKIPLRDNHKGFTNIHNIYFELYDSYEENKLETLTIDNSNKINDNQYKYILSRKTAYSPTNITFEYDFDIYQNDIIAAIQFKNNNANFDNILCLDSYKIGNNKLLTISSNIPYIDQTFYIKTQPIYIVLYQSNVIQLLHHVDITIKDQIINIHIYLSFSCTRHK